MKPELLERLKHLVKKYHVIEAESEASQVNWDAVMLAHGLDGAVYAQTLTEIFNVVEDHCAAEVLRAAHGTWAEYPKFPLKDWYYEVANGDTRLGYWDWVAWYIRQENDMKQQPDGSYTKAEPL